MVNLWESWFQKLECGMDNRKLNVACIFDGYLEVGGGFQTQLRNLKELKKIENANLIKW